MKITQVRSFTSILSSPHPATTQTLFSKEAALAATSETRVETDTKSRVKQFTTSLSTNTSRTRHQLAGGATGEPARECHRRCRHAGKVRGRVCRGVGMGCALELGQEDTKEAEVILAYLGQGEAGGTGARRRLQGKRKIRARGKGGAASGLWQDGQAEGKQAEEENKMAREGITFADLASYLIITEESLQNVSARLPDGVEMDRTKFRPNIVVSGAGAAWEEDFWEGGALPRGG
ncbi:hypothetical protein ABVK25_012475 [Lepraria finkii]|uniref:MOSC domain-containing protein n=1 Tax=Lepraria finkii TaxID=1340010 RepID=A0ABR4AE37_9LECA